MPAALPANSIFICYRRSDSEIMVDRIYEDLTDAFGQAAVFRDIDTIPAGVDFPTFIEQSLRTCAAALICIGPEWGKCPDSRGVPRILDPDDHVRLEIETALSVPHVRVIPLLVLRGAIPSADDIPDTLRPLRRRNGITIRSTGADYRNDVAHLISELRRCVTEVEAARRAAAEKDRLEREAALKRERAQKLEATKQESVTKETTNQEEAAKDTSAQKDSTTEDPPKPKPKPLDSEDLQNILFGIGKLLFAFFLLWLLSKALDYLPGKIRQGLHLPGSATPFPIFVTPPNRSPLNLTSPAPGKWPSVLDLTSPRPTIPLLSPSSTPYVSPFLFPTPTPNRLFPGTRAHTLSAEMAALVKVSQEQIDKGKTSYMTICVACHQTTGMGVPGAFPPLTKSPYVNGSVERFAAIIIKGTNSPFTIDGKTYVVPMPPQDAALDDVKIASIMTFVRNSFENSGGLVTPEMVAAARAKHADRKTPWTQAELDAWKD